MKKQKEHKMCQVCKTDFVIEPEDFAFYEKIEVPPPTLCPECREQRRIAFRNERSLYKRTCDLCKKEVVSRISPDKPYPMYCKECWWSDKWDPLSYGQDYDFSKPFFEQFKKMLFSVPHASIFNSNTVNSDWVNQETDAKNCYLNVGGHYNEDSAYNTYSLYGKNCFDNFWSLNSEFGYQNIKCKRGYKVINSYDCSDCQNTYFSYDCKNCSDIFGCAGLRNKKYCIWNKQHTKEEYEQFLKENPISSYKKFQELKEKSRKVWISIPRRFASIQKSVDVTGNMIEESKNSYNCWSVEKVENAKHLFITAWIKDGYDQTSQGMTELSYESTSGGGLYNSKFCGFCMSGDPLKQMHAFNIQFGFANVTSTDCFACVGVRDKKFCILNKQYTEKEYKDLVPKIIKHINEVPYKTKNGIVYKYGEFFPPELSLFGYNETAAMDYYPLSKEEAIKKGFSWSDYESGSVLQFSDYEIPDDINDVEDDIVKKILKCEESGKAYRIIPMELAFYRRMGIPIPRRAPLQRHKDRMKDILPRRLHSRTCQCAGTKSEKGIYKNTVAHEHHGEDHCPNIMETPYDPKREEIVYCETCYQAETS